MSYLVREPDALIGPVRFDEREVETGHGREIEAPADERAGYGWAWLKPPRHFSTLRFFPLIFCSPHLPYDVARKAFFTHANSRSA